MWGKRKKDKKFFTKREIVLTLLLVMVSICFCYSMLENKWNIKDVIFDNIFTIVISVCCSILSTAILPKMLQTFTITDIRDVLREENEKIINQNNVATPIAVYPASNDRNPEFNDMINKSITNSQNYIFFSDRAMFTAKRLCQDIDIKYIQPTLRIIVFVADIRVDEIFRARKDVYLRRERKICEDNQRKIDEIIRQEKRDILSSIYCLGKLKSKFDITVYLHKEIPFIRFEITDTLFVMSFLNEISIGKKHPTTLVYKNETIFKPNYEEHFSEIIERSYKLQENDFTLEGIRALGESANIICDDFDITEYYNSIENKVKKHDHRTNSIRRNGKQIRN